MSLCKTWKMKWINMNGKLHHNILFILFQFVEKGSHMQTFVRPSDGWAKMENQSFSGFWPWKWPLLAIDPSFIRLALIPRRSLWRGIRASLIRAKQGILEIYQSIYVSCVFYYSKWSAVEILWRGSHYEPIL